MIQLGPWLISCDDTILSINLKISVKLFDDDSIFYTINNLVYNCFCKDEAKAKNIPSEKMLSLNLKSFLEQTISRKIAVDAPILNFDFPKALRIII